MLSPRESWLDDRKLESRARTPPNGDLKSGSAPELSSDEAWKGTFAGVPVVWQAPQPHRYSYCTHFTDKEAETRTASNLPMVMQPRSGGAGPYFLIYVLFDIVINNQKERKLPGLPMALSSLRRSFVGINWNWLGNVVTRLGRKPASELYIGHRGRWKPGLLICVALWPKKGVCNHWAEFLDICPEHSCPQDAGDIILLFIQQDSIEYLLSA